MDELIVVLLMGFGGIIVGWSAGFLTGKLVRWRR